MGNMPKAVETSSSNSGSGPILRKIEAWFNGSNRAQNRQLALTAVTKGFDSTDPAAVKLGDPLSGPRGSGSITTGDTTHFQIHWLSGANPGGWWPRVTGATVKSEMRGALIAALQPQHVDLDIRFRWTCVDPPNSPNFEAHSGESDGAMWIDIISPRPPGPGNYGFTEVSELDSGRYGPLAPLGGSYQGLEGIDTSRDHGSGALVETTGFTEAWTFTALTDPVENGPQSLDGLSYTRDAWRIGEDAAFHSEIGYLLWDRDASLVYRIVTLPRGVTLLAVARGAAADATTLELRASADPVDPLDGGIVSNPFLEENARTEAFVSTMSIIDGGRQFSYEDHTRLVRKDEEPEDHTDRNTLIRV